MKPTTEKAFESYVEDNLSQTSGWGVGTNSEWDKTEILTESRILHIKKKLDIHKNRRS